MLRKIMSSSFQVFQAYSDKYKHFVYSVLLLYNIIAALRVLGLVH